MVHFDELHGELGAKLQQQKIVTLLGERISKAFYKIAEKSHAIKLHVLRDTV